jgi:4-carboxymuconolactone decarboxylase
MTDEARGAGTGADAYERGCAMIEDVYVGVVPVLPKGLHAFNDVMVETLFAGVWTRDVLSVRDRRLLLTGVIAANGAVDTWKVQGEAALERGDLTPEELRETLILLAPYAGYPNEAPLVAATEEIIHARTGSE